MQDLIKKLSVSDELKQLFAAAPSITIPTSREHLLELAMGGEKDVYEIAYDVPNVGRIKEATVTKVRNGVVVNYEDIYLRRRDPKCMLIADNGETDKERYEDRFGKSFDELRGLTFEWLKGQDLIVMAFKAGDYEIGYESLLIAPLNAGFFAGGLADLQYFIPADQIRDGYEPKSCIFLAPHFRHTHFDGKQMVVHNRTDGMYELYSYNLYPGPSAKKGVYGILINTGEIEKDNWVTLHGSTVSVVSPYDNTITIMHEGASGGGKSEMGERIHRDAEGHILLGEHTITKERLTIELKESCDILPITDDMALCPPSLKSENKKLVVQDAENGWFLRTDGIKAYGTDPYLESLTLNPKEPLIFLNYEAVPHGTCLIWNHIEDSPGVTCPNPRVIMPRKHIPNIVTGHVEVDVRSFGVRTPACTAENPTYGIVGMLHVLPPALAWLWRLVSPRGHANPSITDSEGMKSEGVGSYWPFATGKKARQANLLLDQVLETPNTRYILLPNQHIGVYKVGFMPQWIAREYLARRGGVAFKPNQLTQAKCPLLGYAVNSMKVDGYQIPKGFLNVQEQPEVGAVGYDGGAKLLKDFFVQELSKYMTDDLSPLGREIIECFMNDGTVEDYIKLIPMRF